MNGHNDEQTEANTQAPGEPTPTPASTPASGESEQLEDAKPAADKPQQSYLALTKLGMGKKSSAKPQESKDVNKDVNKIGAKSGKKSITEMASSTLFKAGFTKS